MVTIDVKCLEIMFQVRSLTLGFVIYKRVTKQKCQLLHQREADRQTGRTAVQRRRDDVNVLYPWGFLPTNASGESTSTSDSRLLYLHASQLLF